MNRAGRWLLAASLLSGSGCLHFIHPIAPPPPEVAAPCQALPACARKHVHIFLLNGADPLGAGNLAGLRDYVQALGYSKTHYGQLYHAGRVGRELRRVRQEDPEARFVLVGYGRGADAMRSLAQSAAIEGIPIDLLVTLDGGPASEEVITTDDGVRGAPERALGAPSDPETLQILAAELLEITSRVGVVTEAPVPTEPGPEVAPPPRPLNPEEVPQMPSEWDTLRPVSRLQPPSL